MSSDNVVSRSRRLSATVANVSESVYQDHILKRGVGQIVKPAWVNGISVFRILPGLNPDNTAQLDPWRFSANADDYGQWFYPVTCAINVSTPANRGSKTWVLHDPFDTTYDISRNPVVLLRNAIFSAKKQGITQYFEWSTLTEGAKGSPLDKPSACWLVRCVLIEDKDKTYYAPNMPKGFDVSEPTQYMLLKKSAVDAMKAAMEERNPDFRGDPEDIAGQFSCGDPIALSKGAFVVMFNRENDPRKAVASGPRFGSSHGSGKSEAKGYDCYLTSEYKNNSPVYDDYEVMLRHHIKDWSDCVHIPSTEEQIKYLEQILRPHPDLLVYGLDDEYGRMLDPNIRHEGLIRLGRTQVPVAVPAAPAPFRQTAQAAVSAHQAPPAQPAAAPKFGQRFNAPTRSSESPDHPTNTHGISESPESPVVPSSLVTQEDEANARNLLARARRDVEQRGAGIPRPNLS